MMKKKLLALLLALALLLGVTPVPAAAAGSGKLVIIHTNDMHGEYDKGPLFAEDIAAYVRLMKQQYGADNVFLVDAGDAMAETTGKAAAAAINTAGYDFIVPGNHEFDGARLAGLNELAITGDFVYASPDQYRAWGLDTSKTTVLSANIIKNGSDMFADYAIETVDGVTIGFIGITTPLTEKRAWSASAASNGYGFSGDLTGGGNGFYSKINDAVDAAKSRGAKFVVAIGHLGVDDETLDGVTYSCWKSTDVIENSTGIDVFIDGHSHDRIEGREVFNKDNKKQVVLNQTSGKLEQIGRIIVDLKTLEVESAELFTPSEILRAIRGNSGRDTNRRTATRGCHEYSAWRIAQEPTATEPGLRERICRLCGEMESEVIPATETGAVEIVEPVVTEPSGGEENPNTGAPLFFAA